MQALRVGVRSFRSSSSSSSCSRFFSPLHRGPDDSTIGGLVFGPIDGSRAFSQPAVYSPSSGMGKEEATSRVVDLLKSVAFIDPAKVNPTANFKDDLHLDMLDNVEVVMAVEEEFAIDIPENEAKKFSTTGHLIDYIATHPQAK